MKKIIFLFTALVSIPSISKIETLDRIAVIVDDGILMESQIDIALEEIIKRYDEHISKPILHFFFHKSHSKTTPVFKPLFGSTQNLKLVEAFFTHCFEGFKVQHIH